MRKREKKQMLLEKINKDTKLSCIVLFAITTVIYLIKGGMYSLLFDLRESTSVIVYSCILASLLIALVLLNVKDEDNDNMLSSYITVGVLMGILIFTLLLVFTLIDFFLPIIIFIVVYIVIYFAFNYVMKSIVNKKDI